jgi:hypothetical protein
MANDCLTAISSSAVEAVFFFFHRGDESFDHFAKTQTIQFGLMLETFAEIGGGASDPLPGNS